MFQLNYEALPFVGNVCPIDQMDALFDINYAEFIPTKGPDWYQDPKPFHEAIVECIYEYSAAAHALEVSSFDQLQCCNSENDDSDFFLESDRLKFLKPIPVTARSVRLVKVTDENGKDYIELNYEGVYIIITKR